MPAVRLITSQRQAWVLGGNRYYASPKLAFSFHLDNLLVDKEALLRECKTERIESEDSVATYLLLKRPQNAFWEYTPLASALREFGVPSGKCLTNYGNSGSTTGRPTLYIERSILMSGWYASYVVTTGTQFLVCGNNIIGQIYKQPDADVWKVSYNQNKITGPVTLANPTPDRPDLIELMKLTLDRRRQELQDALARHQNRVQELQDQLITQQAELEGAKLALADLTSTTPHTEITDPRVTGVFIGGDSGSPSIHILTSPLIANIEQVSGETVQYNLGSLLIRILAKRWHNVVVTTAENRVVAHPHTNRYELCLGRHFEQLAEALQERGDFALYVSLLINHIQDGIDPLDSVGCRVSLFQKVEPPVVEEIPGSTELDQEFYNNAPGEDEVPF